MPLKSSLLPIIANGKRQINKPRYHGEIRQHLIQSRLGQHENLAVCFRFDWSQALFTEDKSDLDK